MKLLKLFIIARSIAAYSLSGISRRSRIKADIYFKAKKAWLKQPIPKKWQVHEPVHLQMTRNNRSKQNFRLQRFRNHHRKN